MLKSINGKVTKNHKTKEDLIELLGYYKSILNDGMVNYLESLIELETSVIKEDIDDITRKSLSDLEIYKEVALYNIYNRAINLFEQNKKELEISIDDDRYHGLNIFTKVDDEIIKLFNFKYTHILPMGSKYNIPDDYKTMKIGEISLYQTIESDELRKKEMDRILEHLEYLYDQTNPYHSRPGVVGGPASTWAFNHAREVERYEKKLEELDKKISLTDKDKKEIEITKCFHDLILEDYGLSNKNFEEKENYSFNFDEDKSKMKKTLVKKISTIDIENNIKYI